MWALKGRTHVLDNHCHFCAADVGREHLEGCPRSRADDYNRVLAIDAQPPKGNFLVVWYTEQYGTDISTSSDAFALKSEQDFIDGLFHDLACWRDHQHQIADTPGAPEQGPELSDAALTDAIEAEMHAQFGKPPLRIFGGNGISFELLRDGQQFVVGGYASPPTCDVFDEIADAIRADADPQGGGYLALWYCEQADKGYPPLAEASADQIRAAMMEVLEEQLLALGKTR